MVTALIADGDLAGAGRALHFLFNVQQKSDGSFPQNSKVDGTPVWGGLQLDEVGDPIILAYQLGRKDPTTWSLKRALQQVAILPAPDFLAPLQLRREPLLAMISH
jgi:glucoamylase